ncbi:hypothetical protein [Streptomyces sp. 8L]|uniref:hypothetical protein n=1 Tax=Streptomyces sp. 8L TaxID=2877242 RepID=UPI001CD48B4A|nr:hypothetical protein [Streptomyces sp. 8L]MCA1222935.1 hypothetical protein [Streptomyces sp. 8L]
MAPEVAVEAYARTGTTRRHTLRGAGAATAAVLLAGCTSSGPAKPSAAQRTARDQAARAAALRSRAAATSRSLLDQYDAVIARHPGQASRLAPLRAAVAEHVKALAPASPSSPAASATPSGGPAGAAGATAAAVSADPAAAVGALATAEQRASRTQTAALMDAPPELARLLASIAAANSVHQYLLSQGASS